MSKIIDRIVRKLTKLRLQPIRVFCFHQVSDSFDPKSMWECDWTNTEIFKGKINSLLKQGYSFISLPEATKRLKKDWVRRKKYAVLTADDGWSSVLNIVPWLVEQEIPLTLFLNPQYLDGIHYQERQTEKLLTKYDIEHIVKKYHPYITIASHGWIHKDCSKMDMNEFTESVRQSEEYLSTMCGKVPFYAYTFGRHSYEQNIFIKHQGLIPVLADGVLNFNDISQIHRECIDGA